MKLTPIANAIILSKLSNLILESADGDASAIQSQLQDLSTELKSDGEDISDEEVQAAMLNALVDANGDVSQVDVEDVEAIKTEIRESRGYTLTEGGGVLGAIHVVGDVLGNSAFIHELAIGIEKVTGKKIDEGKLKSKIESIAGKIKKVSGFPAKAMEAAFEWITKKLGGSEFQQKVAGIAGTLVATIALLTLAVYFFPSITSGVLIVFAITGMLGKSAEIYKLIKELIHHLKTNETNISTQGT
jgi:hypothetical protein